MRGASVLTDSEALDLADREVAALMDRARVTARDSLSLRSHAGRLNRQSEARTLQRRARALTRVIELARRGMQPQQHELPLTAR